VTNAAERIEMLHLMIEQIYREHYRNFGSTWRKHMESRELAALWSEVEWLEAKR
jgi:hypothetical protein